MGGDHNFDSANDQLSSLPQVPQHVTHNATSVGSHDDITAQRAQALHSMPAYIERSSHVFAICPTVRHRDRTDVVCDYSSWLRNGECRVQLSALMLARHNELPVIVVKGGDGSPHMVSRLHDLGNTT